jgi:hypothetical protein
MTFATSNRMSIKAMRKAHRSQINPPPLPIRDSLAFAGIGLVIGCFFVWTTMLHQMRHDRASALHAPAPHAIQE